MTDKNHEIIWLDAECPNCDVDRHWCQDNVFETCDICGAQPVKYVRADLHDALEVENKRLRELLSAGIIYDNRMSGPKYKGINASYAVRSTRVYYEEFVKGK